MSQCRWRHAQHVAKHVATHDLIHTLVGFSISGLVCIVLGTAVASVFESRLLLAGLAPPVLNL